MVYFASYFYDLFFPLYKYNRNHLMIYLLIYKDLIFILLEIINY